MCVHFLWWPCSPGGARVTGSERRRAPGLTIVGGLTDAPRVRSSSGDRCATAWVLALVLAGCNLGERGGDEPAKQAAPAKQAVAAGAPLAPGSCEATAAKLVELSVSEGKATGREWSAEKQVQKREQFIARCREELPAGKVTRETLLCVEAASELSQAQGCLLAAAR